MIEEEGRQANRESRVALWRGEGERGREGEGEDADKKAAEAAITNPLMSKLRRRRRGGGGEERGRDTNGKFPSLEMQLQEEMEEGGPGRH